jgi:hypothetical protein
VIPEWVGQSLSPDRWSHTCTLVHFEGLRGKHIAIQEALDGKAVDWMAKVSNEQYLAGRARAEPVRERRRMMQKRESGNSGLKVSALGPR